MKAVKTVSLVKQYKNITAVDDLSFEIFKGELFSLLGVNGAGKTTNIGKCMIKLLYIDFKWS